MKQQTFIRNNNFRLSPDNMTDSANKLMKKGENLSPNEIREIKRNVLTVMKSAYKAKDLSTEEYELMAEDLTYSFDVDILKSEVLSNMNKNNFKKLEELCLDFEDKLHIYEEVLSEYEKIFEELKITKNSKKEVKEALLDWANGKDVKLSKLNKDIVKLKHEKIDPQIICFNVFDKKVKTDVEKLYQLQEKVFEIRARDDYSKLRRKFDNNNPNYENAEQQIVLINDLDNFRNNIYTQIEINESYIQKYKEELEPKQQELKSKYNALTESVKGYLSAPTKTQEDKVDIRDFSI